MLNKDTLQMVVTLLKNDKEIAGLSSDLQAVFADAKAKAIGELESHLANVVEEVVDKVIESVVPQPIAAVVESVVDPLIQKEVPVLEKKVEGLIGEAEAAVQNFFNK